MQFKIPYQNASHFIQVGLQIKASPTRIGKFIQLFNASRLLVITILDSTIKDIIRDCQIFRHRSYGCRP